MPKGVIFFLDGGAVMQSHHSIGVDDRPTFTQNGHRVLGDYLSPDKRAMYNIIQN